MKSPSFMQAIDQLTSGQRMISTICCRSSLELNLPTDAGRLQRATRHAMSGARRADAAPACPSATLDPKPLDINVLVSGMSDLLHRTLGETISIETVRGAPVIITTHYDGFRVNDFMALDRRAADARCFGSSNGEIERAAESTAQKPDRTIQTHWPDSQRCQARSG